MYGMKNFALSFKPPPHPIPVIKKKMNVNDPFNRSFKVKYRMMILVILVISPLSISLQVSYKLIKLETNALSGCLLFGAFFFLLLNKN